MQTWVWIQTLNLQFLFGNHSPDTCNDHGTAIDCALHCTMSFCIYNVELLAFFEQCTDLYINSRGCSSETPKKSYQWAVIMSKFLKCQIIFHTTYKNSKKYGTMLYRKGRNILDMLHLTAYKYCSLVQQSKETIGKQLRTVKYVSRTQVSKLEVIS